MYTEYLSPEELASKAKAAGALGISWTFNEPALWFEYTLDGAKLAKAQRLYQIMLRMVLSRGGLRYDNPLP